jgi:hypothetical protein
LVNFLNSKENKCSILEHGTGNSTLFWCKQKNVDTIVSIESSLEWGKQVEQWLSEVDKEYRNKIHYNLIPLDNEKLKSLSKFGGMIAWSDENEAFWKPQEEILKSNKYKDMKFDLIIIDGYDRKKAFLNSLKFLKDDGWILMHDMQVEEFKFYDPTDINIFEIEELDFVSVGPWGSGRGCYGFIMNKKEIKK